MEITKNYHWCLFCLQKIVPGYSLVSWGERRRVREWEGEGPPGETGQDVWAATEPGERGAGPGIPGPSQSHRARSVCNVVNYQGDWEIRNQLYKDIYCKCYLMENCVLFNLTVYVSQFSTFKLCKNWLEHWIALKRAWDQT